MSIPAHQQGYLMTENILRARILLVGGGRAGIGGASGYAGGYGGKGGQVVHYAEYVLPLGAYTITVPSASTGTLYGVTPADGGAVTMVGPGTSFTATGGTGNQTGGAGTTNNITGSSVVYGKDGGGDPSNGTSTNGAAGVNPGDGGNGGGSGDDTTGGNGAKGVVIIRYSGSPRFSGGVITSVSGDTVHTFSSTTSISVA